MSASDGSDASLLVDDGAPHWIAARNGTLMIQRCTDCRLHYFYPRPMCPTCWGSNVEWIEASGRATLFSFSTVYLNDRLPEGLTFPYMVALVDLEEGPRFSTNLVEWEGADIHIGMALQAVFKPSGTSRGLVYFRPSLDGDG